MKSSKVESERIWDGLILVAGLEGNKMIASEGIDERRIGGGRVAGNSQIMREVCRLSVVRKQTI